MTPAPVEFAPPETIHAMLNPATIAVVGASSDLSKWGGRPIKYLRKFGYTGQILPVNPKHSSILDLPCYARPADLPEDIDVALLAIPGDLVLGTLEELAARKCKSAFIFSSGFAELDAVGRERQEGIRAIARRTGLRVCGPNCLGFINIRDHIAAAATSALEMPQLLYEPISLISQSGAIGLASVLNRAHDAGIGFNLMISTGNEADLETADLIAYLVEEPNTRVIAIYSEGFHNGRRFLAALDLAAQRGKPVILLQAGRSEKAKQSTLSHTGLVAGKASVLQGVCRQKGVILARELDDLFEKAMLLARAPATVENRLGILTTSGGIASILSDLCGDYHLEIPLLSTATAESLHQILPAFNPVNNPLDITGQFAGDANLIWNCLKRLMTDPNIDVVLLALTIMNYVPLAEILLRQKGELMKPLVILATGGSLADAGVKRLEASQCFPVFRRADKCIEGLRDLFAFRHYQERIAVRNQAAVVARESHKVSTALGILDSSAHRTLSEHDSKRLVAEFNIPVARECVVHSLEQGLVFADEIGYPIVLKLHGAQFSHKTEVGGVRLNLRNSEELREAYYQLHVQLVAMGMEGDQQEFLVQEMVKGGVEVLAGVSYDAQFGPIVTLGPGGVLTNLLFGHVSRSAPLTYGEAEQMIRDSSVYPLLMGYRSKARADIMSLARLLVNLSDLALALEGVAREVDLNPVIVRPEGQGVVVVDALVVCAD